MGCGVLPAGGWLRGRWEHIWAGMRTVPELCCWARLLQEAVDQSPAVRTSCSQQPCTFLAAGAGGVRSLAAPSVNPIQILRRRWGWEDLRQRVTLSRGGGLRRGRQLRLSHTGRSSPGWDGACGGPGMCKDEGGGKGGRGAFCWAPPAAALCQLLALELLGWSHAWGPCQHPLAAGAPRSPGGLSQPPLLPLYHPVGWGGRDHGLTHA